jgi:beta-glucosidase
MFAAAITKGVQKHPGRGVTLKHFCANNQETNRYNSNSVLSERALREIYLRGFEIAVREAEPYAVMTSYNLLNGIHTSEHKGLLIDVLRRQFGYDGIVMTDWVTAGFLFSRASKYPVPDAADVAAASNDLFMPGSQKEKKEILKGLKEGRVSRKQLAANASRIARTARKMRGNTENR